MKHYGVILFHIFLFVFFTLLSQIGGLVWLLCIPIWQFTGKRIRTQKSRILLSVIVSVGLYLVVTYAVVPVLARQWGRVPLPVLHPSLKPLSYITVLLNRNYVRKEVKDVVVQAADKMAGTFTGTVTYYLDAGFPFINGFPLFPHLSHNDGKKLDLAFYYRDAATAHFLSGAPSLIGYGGCEMPVKGEENTADYCASKGYWQYSLLQKIIPQSDRSIYQFDRQRTRTLIQILAANRRVGKIFIEPYLKKRMHLDSYAKIRFHGCQAVRHDDHLHIQLH